MVIACKKENLQIPETMAFSTQYVFPAASFLDCASLTLSSFPDKVIAGVREHHEKFQIVGVREHHRRLPIKVIAGVRVHHEKFQTEVIAGVKVHHGRFQIAGVRVQQG